MPSPKVSLVAAIAGTALAVPAAASAQIDPGVNYDPGSPAGKEYAIPFVEGRSDGAGTSDPRKGANIPFGVGIGPAAGSGDKQGKRGQRDGRAGDGRTGRDRGEPPQGARRGESADELAARIARAEEPGGTAARTIL